MEEEEDEEAADGANSVEPAPSAEDIGGQVRGTRGLRREASVGSRQEETGKRRMQNSSRVRKE
jgi:hypothetical protein